MDHLTEPLDELRAEVVAFLRDGASRVLHVDIDDTLFNPAVEVLAALEWQPDVSRYVVVLQEPQPPADAESRWRKWAAVIEEEHAHLRSMRVGENRAVQPWPTLPSEVPALTFFAGRALALLTAVTNPEVAAGGLAVVLVPAAPLVPAPDVAAIRGLAMATDLSKVEWIVAERGDGSAKPLRDGITGGNLRTTRCRIDRERQRMELEEMLDSLAVEPGQAAGRHPGCAWPAAPAPPHPSEPAASGVPRPPELAFDPGPTLARALKALRSHDRNAVIETIRAGQAEALGAGHVGLAVDLGLFLGVQAAESLFEAGADIAPALGIIDTSARHARAAGLLAQAAKCGLIAGAIATRARGYVLAAHALGRAASDAKAADATALAVEALYLGGDLSVTAADTLRQHQLRDVALDLWGEALRLTDARSPGNPTARAEDCARRISELTALKNHRPSPVPLGGARDASSSGSPSNPGPGSDK